MEINNELVQALEVIVPLTSDVTHIAVEDIDPEECTFSARITYYDGSFLQGQYFYILSPSGHVRYVECLEDEDEDSVYEDDGDWMDSDALASAGHGTDEDYGYCGDY